MEDDRLISETCEALEQPIAILSVPGASVRLCDLITKKRYMPLRVGAQWCILDNQTDRMVDFEDHPTEMRARAVATRMNAKHAAVQELLVRRVL